MVVSPFVLLPLVHPVSTIAFLVSCSFSEDVDTAGAIVSMAGILFFNCDKARIKCAILSTCELY